MPGSELQGRSIDRSVDAVPPRPERLDSRRVPPFRIRIAHPTRVVDGADVALYISSQSSEARGGRLLPRRRDDGRRELGFWLPGYAEDEGPLLPSPPALSPARHGPPTVTQTWLAHGSTRD